MKLAIRLQLVIGLGIPLGLKFHQYRLWHEPGGALTSKDVETWK